MWSRWTCIRDELRWNQTLKDQHGSIKCVGSLKSAWVSKDREVKKYKVKQQVKQVDLYIHVMDLDDIIPCETKLKGPRMEGKKLNKSVRVSSDKEAKNKWIIKDSIWKEKNEEKIVYE